MTLCFVFLLFADLVKSQTQLTNLPTFYITTTNSVPIMSTDIWVTGKVTIVSSNPTECIKDSTIEIRGRGNSTWTKMAKKSFRMKFGKKTRILNLPAKEKDWVLMANYADKTLLRNAVAFEIGKQLGMAYTPPVRYGDVYLNGDYIGNYLITDQLEVAVNRVPLEKQDTTMATLPDISGGYLLEINGTLDTIEDPIYLKTDKGLNVIVKYPKDDDINLEQKNYIFNFLKNFESTLFSSTYLDPSIGYRNMVDTAAIVNWYLACELTGNPDCFWSTYFYKKRNIDKIIFGPLWDYDIAFSNDDRLGDATQKLMRINAFYTKAWINQFYSDTWFQKKVYTRLLEMKSCGLLQHLQDFIDQKVIELNASQTLNFKRWDILNTKIYREIAIRGSYTAEVSFFKNYLTNHFAYLETALKYTELPVITSTINTDYLYNIVNKKTGKAIDIQDASTADNAKAVSNTLDPEKNSQQWKFIPTSSPDVYLIININSGLALQNDGVSGSQLQQNIANTSSTYQQWKIVPVTTTYAGVQSVLTNKYSINNRGGLATDGNPIIEYINNITGSDNQQWGFVKLNKISTGVESVLEQKLKIGVFPNPVEESTRIYCDGIGAESVQISVYSCQGTLVYTSPKQLTYAGSVSFFIPVKQFGFAQGIYILKLRNDRGYEATTKMVIK